MGSEMCIRDRYEIKRYERDAETQLAPPELKKVHPLGKSPVVEDGRQVLAESGAIIEYLGRTLMVMQIGGLKGLIIKVVCIGCIMQKVH